MMLRRPALETLREALRFDGVRPICDRARLAAGLLGRKHLSGIAEARRVERGLELLHERQVGDREDERHEVRFLQADPVLTGDGAADIRAYLHDLRTRLHHARLLARLARIVED